MLLSVKIAVICSYAMTALRSAKIKRSFSLPSRIEELIEYNKDFVANKKYDDFRTSKSPDRKLAVVTCMDTRLTELLPAALGVKNGDIKLIKTAGGVVSHPFGSIMRSLLVCIYTMGTEEIAIIGHHDCGMSSLDHRTLAQLMVTRGIPEKRLQWLEFYGIDFEKWLKGFDDVRESVLHSMRFVLNHPLVPEGIWVHGLLMHPTTGKLDLLSTKRTSGL